MNLQQKQQQQQQQLGHVGEPNAGECDDNELELSKRQIRSGCLFEHYDTTV